MRGVVDRKGEQFAFVQGNNLYMLDGELSGYVQGEFVVDLAGNRIWRIVGDAIYSLDGNETIGYLGGERPDEWDI
jgi:hypothetical protein